MSVLEVLCGPLLPLAFYSVQGPLGVGGRANKMEGRRQQQFLLDDHFKRYQRKIWNGYVTHFDRFPYHFNVSAILKCDQSYQDGSSKYCRHRCLISAQLPSSFHKWPVAATGFSAKKRKIITILMTAFPSPSSSPPSSPTRGQKRKSIYDQSI